MAKVIEKTAKTVEDALKAALEELSVKENEVEYEIIEEASKGFLGLIGTKPAKIRVTVKENKTDKVKNVDNEVLEKPIKTDNSVEKKEIEKSVKSPIDSSDNVDEETIEKAKSFLQDIFRNMKFETKIEVVPLEEGYNINIHGENLGILIGKHGQTLDALQYLVNLAANRNSKRRIRFFIDIEDYRTRRVETLQSLARNLAERAVRLNQDVKLEPMNRHERKVIHTSLQDNEDITTHSVGEEPHRYIVISPKYDSVKKY